MCVCVCVCWGGEGGGQYFVLALYNVLANY